MDLFEPLHRERHRSSVIVRTLFWMALLLVVLGFLSAGTEAQKGDSLLLIAVGLFMGGIHWFTSPRNYHIFDDRLVIKYGTPRERVILFDQISRMELRPGFLGGRVHIHRTTGRPVHIDPRFARDFHDKLLGALNGYRREQLEERPPEASPPSA